MLLTRGLEFKMKNIFLTSANLTFGIFMYVAAGINFNNGNVVNGVFNIFAGWLNLYIVLKNLGNEN